MMRPPKILLITRNLPPLVGGMERLNWHLADELARHASVKIVGPKGAATLKPERTTLKEVPLNPLPLFLLATFFRALWCVLREKPDVIIAGSGLTAPCTWLLARLCGTKSVAYLHGFDITAHNVIYRLIWRPIFKKMDLILVNSKPTEDLAITAGVRRKAVAIVHPGVKLPTSSQPADAIDDFKLKHGLKQKKILLSVGRLTTRKGLREFVKHSLPNIVAAEPNTVLVVVGEAPRQSLGASIQTASSINAQATELGLASNIKFLGVITDAKLLATVYETADVHVFPVRSIPDDPEVFGMVAIEAAVHGLPTVAFATGGIVDAICPGVSGYLVDNENYDEFSNKVIEILHKPMNTIDVVKFGRKFSWQNFGSKTWQLLFGPDTPQKN